MIRVYANQFAYALFQACGALQGRLNLRLHLVAGPPVELHYDRVLGREVVVRGASGDAGFFRYVPHRGCLEPALVEQLSAALTIRARVSSLFGAAFTSVDWAGLASWDGHLPELLFYLPFVS